MRWEVVDDKGYTMLSSPCAAEVIEFLLNLEELADLCNVHERNDEASIIDVDNADVWLRRNLP